MADELVIRWEIDEIGKLTPEFRFSPVYHHYGLPWRLMVNTEKSERTRNVNYFGLYICCNEDSDCDLWSVECSKTYSLIHRRSYEKCKTMKGSLPFSRPHWGLGVSLIEFAQLNDSNKGFVKDNAIIVEGRVRIKAAKFVKQNPELDFTKPLPDADNIDVKLDGGTLYVCRRYLMWHSPYFEMLLFEDFNTTSVEFKEEFNEFLHVIFPSEKPINADSYAYILRLAQRFQIEKAFDLVEKYLMRTTKVKAATKLLLAEQYGMESLMKKCMNSLISLHHVKVLESTPEFSQMTTALKVSLLAKLFELIKTPE